jgi:hypothetical protein
MQQQQQQEVQMETDNKSFEPGLNFILRPLRCRRGVTEVTATTKKHCKLYSKCVGCIIQLLQLRYGVQCIYSMV